MIALHLLGTVFDFMLSQTSYCQQYIRPSVITRSEAMRWKHQANRLGCDPRHTGWMDSIIGRVEAQAIAVIVQRDVDPRLHRTRRSDADGPRVTYGNLKPIPAPAVFYEGREIVREEPDTLDCDEPRAGWLGLTSMSASRRRVQFDGVLPASRSGTPGTVPDLGETLTFSAAEPAMIFAQAMPCYLDDSARCTTRNLSGTFVVTGRVWYNAGPGGAVRWQLCLARQGEIGA